MTNKLTYFNQFTSGTGGGAGGGGDIQLLSFPVLAGLVFTDALVTGISGSYSMPRAGTVQDARVNVFSNTLDGATTFTMRVNAAPTALTVSVLAGATGVFLLPGSVAVVQNDLLDMEIDASASGGGIGAVARSYSIL